MWGFHSGSGEGYQPQLVGSLLHTTLLLTREEREFSKMSTGRQEGRNIKIDKSNHQSPHCTLKTTHCKVLSVVPSSEPCTLWTVC